VTAILAFLDYAAIRTFFRYLALCDPDRLGQVTQVMAIPVKRQEKRLVRALTREEIEAVLAAPDQSTWTRRRDRVLLLTMYNTGARVSEMTGLRRDQVRFRASTYVELHGKGRKERTVPLWPHTARGWNPGLRSGPDQAQPLPSLMRVGTGWLATGSNICCARRPKKPLPLVPRCRRSVFLPHVAPLSTLPDYVGCSMSLWDLDRSFRSRPKLDFGHQAARHNP
jgi:hypothetical protein